MNLRGRLFHKMDIAITEWMADNGLNLLRWSIAVIFLCFGSLKFFTGLSPAEDIAVRTIKMLTHGLLKDQVILYGLATWEVAIGIGLLFKVFMRETLLLLFLQMIGTFSPIVLFSDEVFHFFPIALTIEGQYIVKNIVIVSAAITIGSTVRGGRLLAKRFKSLTYLN